MADTPTNLEIPVPDPKRLTWDKSHRLGGRGTFGTLYKTGVKQTRGPLVVYGVRRPDVATKLRMGISIGRRAGNAVKRNRIKRLLREAARVVQDEVAVALDIVVVVRPHEPLGLAEYQRLLAGILRKM